MTEVVVVGEAWGRREHQFQHPVVGPTGRELSLWFGITGFAPFMRMKCRKCENNVEYNTGFCVECGERVWPNEFSLMDHWKRLRAENDIFITNVFNVQPPENKLGHFFGTSPETEMPAWKASKDIGGSHVKKEYIHHVHRLWREITDHKPKLVLALGNAACWALLSQTKISSLRGTVTWSERTNTKVLPTYHPAAILRDQSMRPTVLADITKAKREKEFPEIRRASRWITVPTPDAAGLQECRDWFKAPAIAYSCDIETHKNLITMVGFARSRDHSLVIPLRRQANELYWFDADPAELNFWPTAELEFEAWKVIIEGLQTPQPKIFQNGLYDLSYFIRMGIHPKNAKDDTMLWHHSLYPELPKSLGYLGSIYANEVAWKQMRHSESLKRDE